jgi:FkbM family methyltransferase
MKNGELYGRISTQNLTISQAILAFAGRLSRHWPVSFKSKVYQLRIIRAIFRKISAEKELLNYKEKDIVLQCYRRHWVSFCMESYEPVTQKVIQSLFKSGTVFVDAGANVGLYSIRASKAIGKGGVVHAIEPHPAVHSILKSNIANNHCENILTWEVALGEVGGTARLYNSTEPGSHSLLGGESNEGNVVKVLSLDEIIGDRRLDLVKLDLEGSELLALKGMKKILGRRKKPILIMEFCSDWFVKSQAPPSEILALLESYGYRIKAIDDQKRMGPFDFNDEIRNSLEKREFNFNLLCIPNA